MVTAVSQYVAYMESETWKLLSSFLREAYGKCAVCGNKNTKLAVHHNTYERLGREKMEDLTVLCFACHKQFHDTHIYNMDMHIFERTKP